MKQRWQDFWHEPDTGRLYCWWRVLAFLGVALVTAYLFLSVLAMPFFPASLTPQTMSPQLMRTLSCILTIALIAGFGIGGVWAVRWLEQLPFETLGLSLSGPWLRMLLTSLLAGLLVPVALGAAFLLSGMASIHYHAFATIGWRQLGAGAVLIVLASVKKELILHGYLLQTLLRGIGLLAWLLISLMYVGYIYSQAPNTPLIALANLLVLVLLIGMVYLRTGTLWASIGISCGWSLGLLLLHPSAVEGMAGKVSLPISIALSGPSWLSGGNAGPEGGAALSIILLITLGLLTHARKGLSLESHWWEWRDLHIARKLPTVWDFSIGSRYYQWKLLIRDESQ